MILGMSVPAEGRESGQDVRGKGLWTADNPRKSASSGTESGSGTWETERLETKLENLVWETEKLGAEPGNNAWETEKIEAESGNGVQESGSLEADANQEEIQREIQTSLLGDLDLREAQSSLDELLGQENFSLKGAVQELVQGKIPWDLESIGELLSQAFFREIENYRKIAVYLLVIIVASAVFANFVAVFDKGQIADISYYTMYLLMVTLLMKVFASMSQTAAEAVSAALQFMRALLPACIMTLYLTGGSLTAMGFYQISLLAATGIQGLLHYLLLPAVQVYVILLFVNQLMKEDYLSKLASLIRTGILWSLKTVMALLFGMQAIQMMIAPAADRVKTSVVSKAVSAIPGIGGAYETAAQTVLASAVVLKNAVGIAGLAALVFLCAVPAVKLGCGVLLYRALGAVAQPVTDKRVSECMDSVAQGGELLMKMVLHAGMLFILSLAMITVMVRGG